MAHAKHKNSKTKERTAHAPYNFVPLPEKAVKVEREDLPDHDRYYNPHHTGHIDCELITESPLYIRAPLTAADFKRQEEQEKKVKAGGRIPIEDRVRNKPNFFYTNEEDKEPVIPGSSLRGMLRTLVEILSYGKVDGVAAQKLYYRAVADLTLGREYRNQIARRKAGYVIAKKDGSFEIAPAENINGRTFFKVRDDVLCERLANTGFKPMYHYGLDRQNKLVIEKKNDNYEQQYLPPNGGYEIWFQPPGGRDRRGNPIETVNYISTRKETPQHQQGVVVCSGFIEKKKKHTIVTAKSEAKSLRIPESIVEDYRVSLTEYQKQEPPFSKQNGCLVDKRPIFYLERDGNIEWFGHTPNFRVPFIQANRTATTLDFVPENLRNPEAIDLAEAVFGFAKGGAKTSYAGRVFITDARLGPNQLEHCRSDKTIRPRILATPKPTTFQHYLVQPLPDHSSTLKHYSSQPEQETVIRGHKLYWHKGDVAFSDIEERTIELSNQSDAEDKQEKEDTQHTLMQPLPSGLRFQFRICFENLSNIELGALLWALKLPGDNPDSYRHKIGMGKPYGMGAVKIEPRVHLTERQRRNDGTGRYDNLFEEDGKWNLGELSLPECLDVSVRSINDFEQYILSHASEERDKQKRLYDLDRIKALLRILEWPGPQNGELTEYMSLPGFRNRPVLPTPLPILQRRGISRAKVENYKSLADVDVRLGKLTILVGRNGAGKSNFLDALQFVAEGVENLEEAIRRRDGISLIRRWSPPEQDYNIISISIEVEDDLLRGEYQISIASHKDRDGYWVEREKCFIEAENEIREYVIIDGFLAQSIPELEKAQINNTELALKSVSRSHPFDRLYSILCGMRIYVIRPDLMRQPQRADEKAPLARDGKNLASVLQSMEEKKSSQLTQIKWSLEDVVAGLTDLRIEEAGGYLVIKFTHEWGGKEAVFDAIQESEGTLRMLGILTALFQDSAPWLIGLEEPEIAIHPGALTVVYDALTATSQNRLQAIITTHSPDLIAHTKATDLRAVENINGETLIDEIDEGQRELIYRKLRSPSEIMRSGGFRRENREE